jgi:uncharacterized protein (DUF362 family)
MEVVMTKEITRRSFIKKSAAIAATSVVGGNILSSIVRGKWDLVHAAQQVDLSVVKGTNYFNSTIKAVEQLGGMQKFVTKNSKVAILINSPFTNPGTHVNPDVALAVVKMCYDAGAKEIYSLKGESRGYWRKGSLADELKDEIESLKRDNGNYVTYEISEGKSLKKASITKNLFKCDVFINVSVTKDHAGTNFSCILKNMMGAAPHSTNRFFHRGTSGTKNWDEDLDHLSQCIADINLIRKPDLCVADSTEFIVTNGPFGPGKIIKPRKVVAGVDRVLVDTYCCKLLGFDAKNIAMIPKAVEHGLGEMDLSKANIQELET